MRKPAAKKNPRSTSRIVWRKISGPGEYDVWVDESGDRMITSPFGRRGPHEMSYKGVEFDRGKTLSDAKKPMFWRDVRENLEAVGHYFSNPTALQFTPEELATLAILITRKPVARSENLERAGLGPYTAEAPTIRSLAAKGMLEVRSNGSIVPDRDAVNELLSRSEVPAAYSRFISNWPLVFRKRSARPASAPSSRTPKKSVRFSRPRITPIEGFQLSAPPRHRCLTAREIRPALEYAVDTAAKSAEPHLVDALAERMAQMAHRGESFRTEELDELVEELSTQRPAPWVKWSAIPKRVNVFVTGEGDWMRFHCTDMPKSPPEDGELIGRIGWALERVGADPREAKRLYDTLVFAGQANQYGAVDDDDMMVRLGEAFDSRSEFSPDSEQLLDAMIEADVLIPSPNGEPGSHVLASDRFSRTPQGISEYYADFIAGWTKGTGPLGSVRSSFIADYGQEEYDEVSGEITKEARALETRYHELAVKPRSRPKSAKPSPRPSPPKSSRPVRPAAAAAGPRPRPAPRPKTKPTARSAIHPREGWSPTGVAAVSARPEMMRGPIDMQLAREMIATYLRAQGWERDARSQNAYKRRSVPDERWNLAKRFVQHQEKWAGGWRNVMSEPIVQFAKVLRNQASFSQRPAEAAGRLHIDAPDALERLGSIEGAFWVRLQRADRTTLADPHGFFANLAAYRILKDLGEKAAGLTVADLVPSAGMIAGAEGRAYALLPDGQVALLAETASAPKRADAAKIMLVS